MAEIRAFKAFLYSENLKDQMSEIISPPYDVIKESERKQMISTNPLHSVRISLVEDPTDPKSYTNTADLYESWKKDGTLSQTEKPAIYLTRDEYLQEGQPKFRLGFVALMRVSPFEEKKVFPHEYTLAGPKKDRLALLKTMGAEASQIFFAYDDQDLVLEKIYEQFKDKPPRLKAKDASGITREMWLVEDESSIAALTLMIDKQKLLIADGHHRYETALHYAKEEGTPKSQYVQGYFTNTASPGFEILPIHRVTQLPESLSPEDFLSKLQSSYKIEEIEKSDVEPTVFKKQANELCFVLSFGQTDKHFKLSRDKSGPKDAEIFDLQNEIFEKHFGWDISKISKGTVDFEHTLEHYFQAVKNKGNSVGFFLPPTDLKVVMKVVEDGERMPQKSTFFYPKLASGLVIYELGNA